MRRQKARIAQPLENTYLYGMQERLLDVQGLKTHLFASGGVAKAVDGVDLSLSPGEFVGVVGESGCGKTMLALSLLRLVPDPPGRVVDGSVLFKGRDLLRLSEAEMRRVRGNQISMVFQEPMTSLNPVLTVGEQIAESIRLHQGKPRKEALEAAQAMLTLVGIPDPARRLGSYPHELSGGMRQRVVIAMALACDPDLILADEPTTALDVTIQAQILRLMLQLQSAKGTSILLITHDLGVVAQTCSRVFVMYTGRVVEEADTLSLFRNPLHPYTQGLLNSLPRPAGAGGPLTPVGGAVPQLHDLPSGCTFHPRCPQAFPLCSVEAPPFLPAAQGGRVRCWLYA